MEKLELKIAAGRSYNICIADGAFSKLAELVDFSGYSQIFVLSEHTVWSACSKLLTPHLPEDVTVLLVPSGEAAKDINTLDYVWKELQSNGADRRSLLLNFGGGAITDLGGFAASTYMRGIDFIHLPTTLLSQVDASVGGKTGINLTSVKNAVGTFTQPKAVIIDTATLAELPEREIYSGMAENIKHAAIYSKDFFAELEAMAGQELSEIDWPKLIAKSVAIKAEIVAKDEKESGLRKLLNFGHTAGHAYESILLAGDNPMTHGEAIAVGMCFEARLAVRLGLLDAASMERLERLLVIFNLPLSCTEDINEQDFLDKIAQDKKNVASKINWTLIDRIGHGLTDQDVAAEIVKEVYNEISGNSHDISQGLPADALNSLSALSVNGGNAKVIQLSGSKSHTNRALILAAVAKGGKTTLLNASNSKDTALLVEGLRKFGVVITENPSFLEIQPPQEFTPYKGKIDIGPAGTTMRFLTALAATIPGAEVELCGTDRMHERPIADLVEPLIAQGIKIEYLGKEACPPIKVYGRKKQASCTFEVSAEVSSQYLTSILLVASRLASYVEVNVTGEMVSSSYVDLTLSAMRQFGVNIINEGYSYFLVAKTHPEAGSYQIEGDATGAGYFWALAAAMNDCIRTENIPMTSLQGDLQMLPLLEKMGCEISAGNDDDIDWIQVKGTDKLRPIQADLLNLPDSGQTLAVLSAFCLGKSSFTGLATLKHKETDRLSALSTELAKLDIKSEIDEESITVHGGSVKVEEEVRIDTYEDHRMAMSFAILAARVPTVKINDPEVVEKSFPDFWTKLASLGIQLH